MNEQEHPHIEALPIAGGQAGTKKPDDPIAIGLLFSNVKLGMADHVLSQIEDGINLNRQDESGMTVLHHAVALGARPCIRALVNSGRCDYLIRDNQGRYASDIAIEWSRDFAVARLLSKHQARQAHARGVLPFENSQR